MKVSAIKDIAANTCLHSQQEYSEEIRQEELSEVAIYSSGEIGAFYPSFICYLFLSAQAKM